MKERKLLQLLKSQRFQVSFLSYPNSFEVVLLLVQYLEAFEQFYPLLYSYRYPQQYHVHVHKLLYLKSTPYFDDLQEHQYPYRHILHACQRVMILLSVMLLEPLTNWFLPNECQHPPNPLLLRPISRPRQCHLKESMFQPHFVSPLRQDLTVVLEPPEIAQPYFLGQIL